MGAPSIELAAIPGLVAAVLATHSSALGGIVMRGPPGPFRDDFLSLLRELMPPRTPWFKVPVNVSDDRLLGGLDLGATLNAGRPVFASGLLTQADGGFIELSMAERQSAATVAALAAALDEHEVRVERDGIARVDAARFAVVACDEARDDDEPIDRRLRDRLALSIDTTQAMRQAVFSDYSAADCRRARRCVHAVAVAPAAYRSLCDIAEAMQLHSPRCVLQAVNVARALAALEGRETVEDDDLSNAALIALIMRVPGALELLQQGEETEPEEQADEQQPPPSAEDSAERDAHDEEQSEGERADDSVDEAASALLPDNMLAALAAQAARHARKRAGGKSGARARALARGRPIGITAGKPGGGQRLDVLATLKAAAPLQRMRNRVFSGGDRLSVRSDDLRLRRFQQKQRTTTIFVVDASGSAAVQRLAETKGAIELLLAECYVRRDQVALIAFRDAGAEALLAPTRSLVRAKRALSALPGGGATPLAHGLKAALDTADAAAKRGETPLIVLLTDARANVGLDGVRGSPDALTHAVAVAGEIGERGYQVLAIDTGRRPSARAQQVADAMSARYLPLPFADAASVSAAVRGAAA